MDMCRSAITLIADPTSPTFMGTTLLRRKLRQSWLGRWKTGLAKMGQGLLWDKLPRGDTCE